MFDGRFSFAAEVKRVGIDVEPNVLLRNGLFHFLGVLSNIGTSRFRMIYGKGDALVDEGA